MSKLHFFKTIFLRYPDRDVVFHIYYYYCDESPEVTLSEEHVAYTWVTPQGALLMSDLMIDLDGCIKLFYRI